MLVLGVKLPKKIGHLAFQVLIFFFSGDPVLGAAHLLIEAIEMMEGHLASMCFLGLWSEVSGKNGIIKKVTNLEHRCKDRTFKISLKIKIEKNIDPFKRKSLLHDESTSDQTPRKPR